MPPAGCDGVGVNRAVDAARQPQLASSPAQTPKAAGKSSVSLISNVPTTRPLVLRNVRLRTSYWNLHLPGTGARPPIGAAAANNLPSLTDALCHARDTALDDAFSPRQIPLPLLEPLSSLAGESEAPPGLARRKAIILPNARRRRGPGAARFSAFASALASLAPRQSALSRSQTREP